MSETKEDWNLTSEEVREANESYQARQRRIDEMLRKAQRPKRDRHRGWRMSEMAGEPDPIMVLKDRIPQGFGCGYAMPKRGKTFYYLALVLHMANGSAEFQGVPLLKSGKVFYLVAEGGRKLIERRAKRMIAKYGLDPEKIEQNFILVDQPINLMDAKSVDHVVKVNADLGPFVFVVIDTLARNMLGDENSTADMNKVVAGCDHIRGPLGFGCTDLMLVHHQGWSKVRPRGAIALFGAVDYLMRFDRQDDLTVVIVEEMRDGVPLERPDYFIFDGGVLVSTEGPATGIEKLKEREAAMRVLLVALAVNGPVTLDVWRAKCEASGHIKGTAKTAYKQWDRALKRLLEAQCIRVLDGKVQPCDPPIFDDDDEEAFGE